MRFFSLSTKSCLLGLCLATAFVGGLGCDETGKDKKNSAPQPTAPAPAPAPAPSPDPSATAPSPDPKPASPSSPGGTPSSTPAGGGAWNLGPGIEGCVSQGKVWVAVGDGSGPGYCGDQEAQFCCTEAEILRRYSSISSLSSDLQKVKATGAKLYQCSTDGKGKTLFHFAGFKGGSIVYQFLGVTEALPAGNPPANCPRPTLADLGFPTSTGGSSSGTGSGTSTSRGTSTTTVP